MRLKPLLRDKLFLSLLLLVIWLPVPLGSNRVVFWTFAELVVGAIFFIWLWQYLATQRQLTPAFKKAKPVLYLWLAWIAWLVLQIIPMPVEWVAWLSPKSAWLHGLAIADNALPAAWITLSVEPYSSATGLIKSLCYLQLFVLVLLLVRRSRQVKLLAYALILSGFIQAAYGIVIALMGIDTFFFEGTMVHNHVVTGGFANRNHLANYLTMTVAVGLGVLIAQLNTRRVRGSQMALRAGLSWLMSSKASVRFTLLLMSAAIVMTHSRMGNVSFFASMLIAGAVALVLSLLSKRASRGLIILLASLIIIDIVIVGSVVGLGRVVERLEHTSEKAETRDEVAKDSLVYWQDYPLTGSGLGTFYTTYPRYKSEPMAIFYKNAHNDYLHFATETGAVGIFLLGSMVISSLIVAGLAFYRRRDPWMRGIAFAVMMSIVALLIHSTVEFNFQIPANSATFVMLLALAWVACFSSSSSRRSVVIAVNRQRQFLVIGLMLVTVLVSVQALRWCVGEMLSIKSERSLQGWMKGREVNQSDWQAIYDNQQRALQYVAASPEALTRMARITLQRLSLASYRQANLEDRIEIKTNTLDAALSYLLAAIERNPAHARAWVTIAEVRHRQQRYDSLFVKSLLRAQILAPYAPPIQQGIVSIGMAAQGRMSGLSQRVVRELVNDTIKRGLATSPGPIKEIMKRYEVD